MIMMFHRVDGLMVSKLINEIAKVFEQKFAENRLHFFLMTFFPVTFFPKTFFPSALKFVHFFPPNLSLLILLYNVIKLKV